MRAAPIGLYLGGRRYESDKIDMIGAETAALTHGHELGYIPAAAFVHMLIAAVNHSGASSSTGAVTGSIMGTYLGYSSIPDKYIENLELKNVILELADDLYHDCIWNKAWLCAKGG